MDAHHALLLTQLMQEGVWYHKPESFSLTPRSHLLVNVSNEFHNITLGGVFEVLDLASASFQ